MSNRLLALGLILKRYLSADLVQLIDDESGRVRIQKLVYLLQSCGADLGYNFSWYKRGPYSSSLTSDYYELRNELSVDNNLLSNSEIEFSDPGLQHKLHVLVEPPIEFKPDEAKREEFWLELVASLHYLTQLSDFTPDRIDHILTSQKPHLEYTLEIKAMANQALHEAGL